MAMAVVKGGEIKRQQTGRVQDHAPRPSAGWPAPAVKAKKKPRIVPRHADQARQEEAVPERGAVVRDAFRMASRFAIVKAPPSVNVRRRSHPRGSRMKRKSRSHRIRMVTRRAGSRSRRRRLSVVSVR